MQASGGGQAAPGAAGGCGIQPGIRRGIAAPSLIAAAFPPPPRTAAEWVNDHPLTKGLYPNCESLLVPALQGREGLMFMPSYRKALAECARVLKPGGTFAATVWQAEQQVPFFLLAREVASEYDAASTPSAGSSIAGRFGDPAELLEAISGAFGSAAECRLLEVEFSMAPGMWWREVLDMPLPIQASRPLCLWATAAMGGAVQPHVVLPSYCCQPLGVCMGTCHGSAFACLSCTCAAWTASLLPPVRCRWL